MASAHDAMQMAVEHVAVAEEAAQTGDGSKARLHTEMAKGLTTLARELRIGNGNTGRGRSPEYRDVVLKPVIVNPPALTTGSEDEADDDFDARLESDEAAAVRDRGPEEEAGSDTTAPAGTGPFGG